MKHIDNLKMRGKGSRNALFNMFVIVISLILFTACGEGSTTVGDGNNTGNGNPQGDTGPSPTDTLAYAKAMTVGGWAYFSSDNSNTPWIHANYFMCPSGGVKGVEETSEFVAGNRLVYLAKGSWNVTATTDAYLKDYASIILKYTTTTSVGGVVDTGPGILGAKQGYMVYIPKSDRITYWFNGGWHYMNRLVDGSNKEVDDSYCGTSSVNAKQCGTDSDCGRCWYCDKSGSSNICRYGGEGPYGCYRGWNPPK